MTAINTATQVPLALRSGAQATLERLLAWAAMTLAFMHAGRAYKETNDPDFGTVDVVSASINRTADGRVRLIVRASLLLNDSYASDAGKLWLSVQELGQVEIPAQFLVD